MQLLITNKRTLETIRGDELAFERLTGIDPDQLRWSIEEYFRCDANHPGHDEYVAIEEEFHS